MLAVDQIQKFYLYKKRTDSRFSVPTVVDLFIDNDDDDDGCPASHHKNNFDPHGDQREMIRKIDERREKMGKALNKHRYLTEELNLAIEQLATDRANLMLERHLLAVTKERMRMKKELVSSSSCLRGLIRSKFKAPLESLSMESLLDVDKNNNSKSSAASTSELDSGRNFQANVMLEDRVRKHFPKLRDRCRNLTNTDEAARLQEDIKLQEEILNYLYLKVEAIIFKKSFKKPTNNKPTTSMALVLLSSSSTPSKPKSDDKRRKRKQLQTTSRTRTNSSEETRSSGIGSIDSLFRDVIRQVGTESRSTSRSTSSTTGALQQITIDIADS
ncbi:uncharacterized protein LOC129278734 [Lytechinus pictus]|uniref:uncharacterized protein LOC129278734 n=1 Tax=Lytechinus pictus TaxID=7653 RepID=UPI0030BA02D5